MGLWDLAGGDRTVIKFIRGSDLICCSPTQKNGNSKSRIYRFPLDVT